LVFYDLCSAFVGTPSNTSKCAIYETPNMMMHPMLAMAPPPPAKPAGPLKHYSGISKNATLSKESSPRIYSPSKKSHADFAAICSSKNESDDSAMSPIAKRIKRNVVMV
jgi:hypothetical protein